MKLVDIATAKKRESLKARIKELETQYGQEYQRVLQGISDFKKGYQPKSNIVKDEKGDLVAECHSILDRWRNDFSWLLNVHGVNDVRQTEIHTAEPLVRENNAFGVEMAIEELNRY